MTAVLSTILDDVRKRLAERRRATSLAKLRDQAMVARQPWDFIAALEQSKPAVIAEVKRKSPSMGDIDAKADPVKVARQYASAGAAALSVLTEADHFGGAPEVLTAIRERLPKAALLMKDFVVDLSQLLEARVWGADCVLLMVSVLGESIDEYLALATALGLTSLVEVHDADEMKIAVRAGAPLIGINNRNLKTMEVKLESGIALAAEAPKGALLVAESGIATGADVKRLAKAGFHAFLVGTALMRDGEPGQALEKLRREAKT
ncbi:MAG: indole-3-glycerol phosphate synthase TrpC [Myxococcota bacterium]|nr:indole-3-glycerol phosphate synthase TrpC [Myxococcota bacterium]